MGLKEFWHRLFGTKPSNHRQAQKKTAERHVQGGTHEQHVDAGHKGGAAPHVCRGRACHHEEKKK